MLNRVASRGEARAEARVGPVDRRLVREAAVRRAVAAGVVCGLVSAASIVVQAVALAGLLAAAMGSRAVHPLGALLWIAAGAAVRGLCAIATEVTGARGSEMIKAALRSRLVRAAVTQATRKAISAGDIAALAGRGVDALDPYIARCLPDLVLAAAVPVTLVVVIGAFDWVSAIALASVLVLFPLFGVLVGASSNDLAARRWRHVEAFARQIADVFEGLPLLKALGQSARQRERIALASDALRVASLSTLRIAFLSALVLDTLASVSVALVAVPLGLRLLNGSISLAAALAVLMMAPEVFLPLRRASAEFHESTEGLAAARRAMDVIDAAVCEGDPHPKHAVPDPVHATVALRNVRVEFAGTSPPILDGASLEVAPGEHVVVVGANGAGKSTALSLVLGLLGPARGTVTVGGRDLRGADLDVWRRHIAYLPEHPTLLAASLADNLRLANPQSTRADLMGALEQAGAGVFVDTLPAGLDTVLGDGGRTVSMGERQRIAVARVLLREASLYLLDEPTAHLDAAAEHAVIEALRRRLTGRSALIITHSSAVTLLGDRVLELNAGCFVPGRGGLAPSEPATLAMPA